MHNLQLSFVSRPTRAVERWISRFRDLSLIAGVCLIGLTLGGLPTIASAQALGDTNVEPAMDNDAAGMAEAFRVIASSSETVNRLKVYVDSSSQASKVTVGLYTDANGHPGSLLVQGSKATPAAGSWNTISITSTQVTAGRAYWIAVLGTGGTLAFRDDCCGGGTPSENSAQTSLTSLPGSWSSGLRWSDGSLSANASSSTTPPPPPPGQIATGTATVSWMPPTANTNGSTLTNLAGYKVHYGTSASNLNQTIQVANPGSTNYVLTNLTSGARWYFGVTSYTSKGVESSVSNIVSKAIP